MGSYDFGVSGPAWLPWECLTLFVDPSALLPNIPRSIVLLAGLQSHQKQHIRRACQMLQIATEHASASQICEIIQSACQCHAGSPKGTFCWQPRTCRSPHRVSWIGRINIHDYRLLEHDHYEMRGMQQPLCTVTRTAHMSRTHALRFVSKMCADKSGKCYSKPGGCTASLFR